MPNVHPGSWPTPQPEPIGGTITPPHPPPAEPPSGGGCHGSVPPSAVAALSPLPAAGRTVAASRVAARRRPRHRRTPRTAIRPTSQPTGRVEEQAHRPVPALAEVAVPDGPTGGHGPTAVRLPEGAGAAEQGCERRRAVGGQHRAPGEQETEDDRGDDEPGRGEIHGHVRPCAVQHGPRRRVPTAGQFLRHAPEERSDLAFERDLIRRGHRCTSLRSVSMPRDTSERTVPAGHDRIAPVAVSDRSS